MTPPRCTRRQLVQHSCIRPGRAGHTLPAQGICKCLNWCHRLYGSHRVSESANKDGKREVAHDNSTPLVTACSHEAAGERGQGGVNNRSTSTSNIASASVHGSATQHNRAQSVSSSEQTTHHVNVLLCTTKCSPAAPKPLKISPWLPANGRRVAHGTKQAWAEDAEHTRFTCQ